jgi:hypothetical protein
MIVVIQCAGKKQPDAGSLQTTDGRPVFFVANPETAPDNNLTYARPDDLSDSGSTWREKLLEYNDNPGSNPLRLYPAYALYHNPAYQKLVDHFGLEKTFILSAGWGLIAASFLTPTYDITFSASADNYIRRRKTDVYHDFSMLPANSVEDIYYFGGKDYVAQFCRLTSRHDGRRIVFYNSSVHPQAPGCEVSRYETSTRTNWHYECVNAFISSSGNSNIGNRAPKSPGPKPRADRSENENPTNRNSHGRNLDLEDAAIREAIHNARKGIGQYLWLMRSLNSTNVTENKGFQRKFNAFYRVRQRSTEWYSVYYELLQRYKNTGASFDETLDTLWKKLGRYEPSFSSKLVATIDPAKPIWDRFVLMNSGLKAPLYTDVRKLAKAKIVYRQIRGWYFTQLQSENGQRILKIFDEEVPEHEEISKLKKLDFVLWQIRTAD